MSSHGTPDTETSAWLEAGKRTDYVAPLIADLICMTILACDCPKDHGPANDQHWASCPAGIAGRRLAAWRDRTPLRDVPGLREAVRVELSAAGLGSAAILETAWRLLDVIEPLLFGEREPTR